MSVKDAAENLENSKRIIIMVIDEINKLNIPNARKDFIIKHIGERLSRFDEFIKEDGNPNKYKEI